MKKNFKTRKYRVRKGVKKIIKYLEWKDLCNEKELPKKNILDYVIHEAIEIIEKKNFKLEKKQYRGREPETFTMDSDSIKKLNLVRHEYNAYIGEMIEICIYIYCYFNLSKEEMDVNELYKWKISILKIDSK